MTALTIYDSFKDEIEPKYMYGVYEPPKYDWKQVSVDCYVTADQVQRYLDMRNEWEATKVEKAVRDKDEWQRAKNRMLEIFSLGNVAMNEVTGLNAVINGEDVDDTPQPALDFSADPGRVRAFACMEEVKCPGNWEMRFDDHDDEWIFTLPLWNDTLEFRLTFEQVEYFSFNPETIASILAFNAEEQIKAWEERQGKRW